MELLICSVIARRRRRTYKLHAVRLDFYFQQTEVFIIDADSGIFRPEHLAPMPKMAASRQASEGDCASPGYAPLLPIVIVVAQAASSAVLVSTKSWHSPCNWGKEPRVGGLPLRLEVITEEDDDNSTILPVTVTDRRGTFAEYRRFQALLHSNCCSDSKYWTGTPSDSPSGVSTVAL